MLPLTIDDLVREMKDRDASDLHLTSGSKPMIRRRGELEPLDHHELLTPDVTRDVLYRILSTEQQKVLETKRHIDMAYSIPGVGRLRVNIFFQRAALGAAFRMIPNVMAQMGGKHPAGGVDQAVDRVLNQMIRNQGMIANGMNRMTNGQRRIAAAAEQVGDFLQEMQGSAQAFGGPQ